MGIRIAWQLLTRYFKQIDLIWWAIFLMMLAISLAVFIVYRRRGGAHKATVFWCALIPYSLLIFAATVFSREKLEEQYWNSIINLDISTAWRIPQWRYGIIDTATGIGLNILMFLPCGYLLGRLFKKTMIALGICFLITLSIETLQLATKRGFFELSDILLNMIGAAFGYYVAAIINKRESNGEAGK